MIVNEPGIEHGSNGGQHPSVPLRVFIQARMGSRRFPGKVLAPFLGQPLIKHVVLAVARALPHVPITVLTSRAEAEMPLVAYLNSLGVAVFRGPLDAVFGRFRQALTLFPCEWFVRICADSPLLDPHVLQAVAYHPCKAHYDVVTTIFPRTFPKGHNAELLRVSSFMAIDEAELSSDEQEHVTPYYYRQPDRFRIGTVTSGNPGLATWSLAVDTVEDLQRLEHLSAADLQRFAGQVVPVYEAV
jgi:spore coat polysaccharide biosynthesis protein SpsF (cytidylyltransferase family)